MLAALKSVKPFVKVRYNSIQIDNFAFKLHYRWSFVFLIVCALLVCCKQFVGDHINCLSEDDKIKEKVVDSFCFFKSTFTIVELIDLEAFKNNEIAHLGVGPNTSKRPESIKRHAYYQWVPFVLFVQAVLFYIPHQLWKCWEGDRLKRLTEGLHRTAISKHLNNGESLEISGRKFRSKKTVEFSVRAIKNDFINRLEVNKFWGAQLCLAELMNLCNVVFQIYFVNRFLAGQFLSLGSQLLQTNNGTVGILEVVFPKVTKCVFRKFGAGGGVQEHDVVCVMALNIINEKIYSFLWFWFVILFFVSIAALIWRIITFRFYKSLTFNSLMFLIAGDNRTNRQKIGIITKRCTFSNWIFLYYLACNLDGFVFREVLDQLAEEFEDQKYSYYGSKIQKE